MTKQEYKRIKKILDRLEEEALIDGVDITTYAYKKKFDELKRRVLEHAGLTEIEWSAYEEPKGDIINLSVAWGEKLREAEVLINKMRGIRDELVDRIGNFEDIYAEQISLLENRFNVASDRINLSDREIKRVDSRVSAIKIPEMPEIKDFSEEIDEVKSDIDSIIEGQKRQARRQKRKKEDVGDIVSKRFSASLFRDYPDGEIKINKRFQRAMLEPTNRRAMGLQEQIDTLSTTVDTTSGRAPEDLSAQCDGSTTAFATTYSISSTDWVTLNGTMLIESVDFTKTGDKEITLSTVTPDTGEELYIKYRR